MLLASRPPLLLADPIKYAIEALVAPQFYCEGPTCPTITYLAPSGQVTVDRFEYVQTAFGVKYSNRWNDIGYLMVFATGIQILHFIFLRHVAHIKR